MGCTLRSMSQRSARRYLAAAILALLGLRSLSAAPTPAATSAFNAYIDRVEAGHNQRYRSPELLVHLAPRSVGSLHRGELLIEEMTPAPEPAFAGAMLHHWRGTAFVPGVGAADFDRILEDFAAYPQIFAPQILRASARTFQGEPIELTLRVRQKHVITVVMDTVYDVSFGQLDPQHRFSTSRSTSLTEIGAPGTAEEHRLSAGEEHGFLWRMNTYWTYSERDGGLYLQVESVSLSRAVPTGLGWALRPYVESVPREAIEFTLRAARNALQGGPR